MSVSIVAGDLEWSPPNDAAVDLEWLSLAAQALEQAGRAIPGSLIGTLDGRYLM